LAEGLLSGDGDLAWNDRNGRSTAVTSRRAYLALEDQSGTDLVVSLSVWSGLSFCKNNWVVQQPCISLETLRTVSDTGPVSPPAVAA